AERNISREDQDAFALRSQQRTAAAQADGRLAEEIVPVTLPVRKGAPQVVDRDEHPRASSLEALAKLPTPFRKGGTVTAGNASGVNDGACALLLSSGEAAERLGLAPRSRILGSAVAGVAPRTMGLGPVPATRKLLARLKLTVADFDLVELNEAFAAQALAVLRDLGIADEAGHVNPQGGAIALGHPLGMSGARLVVSLVHELRRRGGRRGLATLCVGVGQGQAALFERWGAGD
ncbi:MAG TPA: acetyl-CoA C-acyltransferase, partial [Gaiellales bacterium]|nr:acetyl-CoA C-acyltransferase [Gaiellales bacterium]